MLPVVAVLVAAVLFGTTGTAQALGPADTTPLGVGVARLLVGGTALALGGFALPRLRGAGRPMWPGGRGRTVALTALTGVCLAAYQPLFFLGTARNGVAIGTVIALGSAPVLAGVIEWARTRRAPQRVWLVATGLAAVGVALLAFGGGGGGAETTGAVELLGVVGSLGAGASFAIFANAQRALLDGGADPFAVAGAMGGWSALCALAAAPFVDLSWALSPAGAVTTGWLGLATIAAAYLLFTWGLDRLRAATAATLTLAEPVTATLLGVLVLGERLGLLAVAGILVLAAGLVILAVGTRRPRPFPVEA